MNQPDPATPSDTIADLTAPRFVVCIGDQGDALSVIKGKVYRVLPPELKDPDYYLRVVDETGEDYLYDKSWFVPIDLPPAAVAALEAA